MTKAENIQFMEAFFKDIVETVKKKNADYTGEGDDPFANFRTIGHLTGRKRDNLVGLLARTSDKLSRVGSFVSKGVLLVKDESVLDTLKDGCAYCALMAAYIFAEKASAKKRKAKKTKSTAARKKKSRR